jgi:soluble lytic murein transglycosylase-like protein
MAFLGMAFSAVLALHAAEVTGARSDSRPRRITTVVRADPRTGRLVRTVVVTPKPAALAPRAAVPAAAPERLPAAPDLDDAVRRIAAEHALSPELLHSVIRVESNFDPYAVSAKGALGLMQLIPATARRFGVADVFDPVENIQGGARYLKYLLELYGNDTGLALAAYNAGEGAVARYGGVPPYAETRNYVNSVARRLEEAKKTPPPAPAAAEKPAVQSSEAKPSGPNHIQEIVEPDGSVRYVSR